MCLRMCVHVPGVPASRRPAAAAARSRRGVPCQAWPRRMLPHRARAQCVCMCVCVCGYVVVQVVVYFRMLGSKNLKILFSGFLTRTVYLCKLELAAIDGSGRKAGKAKCRDHAVMQTQASHPHYFIIALRNVTLYASICFCMNMRPGNSNARVHGHRIRSVRLRQQLLDDVIEDLVLHVLLCQRLWSCHSMDRQARTP